MTIYMSCFGCSKVITMVEDPLKNIAKVVENTQEIIQDISGVVIQMENKVEEVVQETTEVIIAVKDVVTDEVKDKQEEVSSSLIV